MIGDHDRGRQASPGAEKVKSRRTRVPGRGCKDADMPDLTLELGFRFKADPTLLVDGTSRLEMMDGNDGRGRQARSQVGSSDCHRERNRAFHRASNPIRSYVIYALFHGIRRQGLFWIGACDDKRESNEMARSPQLDSGNLSLFPRDCG